MSKPEKTEKKLFPTGPSLVVIRDVSVGTSKVKGTPEVTFRLDGQAADAKGLAIYRRCYLTDSAMWQIEDTAAAVGVSKEEATKRATSSPVDIEWLLTNFVGRKLKVVVQAETYTHEGIQREGREIVAIESIDANCKAYMDKCRIARKTGGICMDKQPLVDSDGKPIVAKGKPEGKSGGQGSKGQKPTQEDDNSEVPF